MYQMTENQTEGLRKAQCEAAEEFWTYPDRSWQEQFQSDWLLSHLGVDQAQSPDGLAWGSVK